MINRKSELQFLEEKYKSNSSEFIIFYGNRRIGKTYLLKHFLENKTNSTYFLCEENSLINNAKRFKQEIAKSLNDSFLDKIELNSFYDIFEYLTKKTNKKQIIVLDEFSYLVENDKTTLSHFQRIWDELLVNSKIMLIICGSSFSTMINEVLDKKSPLYGRRTGSFQLKEMELEYFKEFFPSYNLKQLLKVYAILGGTTQYLTIFENSLSIEKNIEKHIISKKGFFYEEPDFILLNSFRNPLTYSQILQAISKGKTQFSQILSSTQIDKSILSRYLEILEKLQFIEKKAPLFTKQNSRNYKYYIKNNFLRFYYYFLEDKKNLLELEKNEEIMLHIQEQFDKYFSYIFEDICKDFLNKKYAFLEIGNWWHKGEEIDIVARDSKSVYFAEVKWRNSKITISQLIALIEKTKLIPTHSQLKKEFILFSKSGFDSKITQYIQEHNLNVTLYTLKDLENEFFTNKS